MKKEFLNTAALFRDSGLANILTQFPYKFRDAFGREIASCSQDKLENDSGIKIVLDEEPIGELISTQKDRLILKDIIEHYLERFLKLEKDKFVARTDMMIVSDAINFLHDSLSQEMDLKQVFIKILHMLRSYTYTSSLLLYKVEDGCELEALVGIGDKGKPLDYCLWPTRLARCASLVARQKQMYVANKADDPLLKFINNEHETEIKNIAIVPLCAGEQVLGVLVALDNPTEKLSQQQLEAIDFYSKIIFQVSTEKIAFTKLKALKQTTERLEQYLDHNVVEEVCEKTSEELEGVEKKLVTLFIKIANFSTIRQEISAKHIIDILNFHFDSMASIVERHQGTIDKTIGDVMMVVWGHPNEVENAEELAVNAALEMQETVLNSIKPLLKGRGLSDFEVGIGINSGSAVAGNLGAKDFMDYTVIGDSINLAQRLESKAQNNEIWVRSDVVRDIKDLKVKPTRVAKNVKVKGKKEGVTVFIFAPP